MSHPSREQSARDQIHPESDLVAWHLDYMAQMVKIDSRSFSVNEFKGDRKEPTDMKEILDLTVEYLKQIGFPQIKINQPEPSNLRTTPILMAEIPVSPEKPTVLLYAHLDKQPYMDDENFSKWEGVPPWELRWNEDRSRAYGRGAADDLSGVISIGIAVDALLKAYGVEPNNRDAKSLQELPCNIKVIFETEEECGSQSLISQILQNRDFFKTADCVIITDVVNPATGVPGLTTSLRGIIQCYLTLEQQDASSEIDAQTALYHTLASLVHEDHSLAIEGIARTDIPVSEEERKGLAKVPTSVKALRDMAGLLPETGLTVPDDKVSLLVAQLRKSFANVRPGHRIAGGVIFGSAGARLTFRVQDGTDKKAFADSLRSFFETYNIYNLKIDLGLKESSGSKEIVLDLVIQSSSKDPHSGVNGGPFPVPELQLAHLIYLLILPDGTLADPGLQECMENKRFPAVTTQSLMISGTEAPRPFDNPSAKALVEIRLAPGNKDTQALEILRAHLIENTPPGFKPLFEADKGGEPWSTGIEHPAFRQMLDSLEIGFGVPSCIYGCGGSIPFVAKLMDALGDIPPMCIAAYDPECKMHEPNESLSMKDLMGCAKTIVHFFSKTPTVFTSS